MMYINRHQILSAIVATAFLLTSASAFGFRCGQKLVRKNMHEAQVRKACGAPTTARDVGVSTRSTYIPVRRSISPGIRVQFEIG